MCDTASVVYAFGYQIINSVFNLNCIVSSLLFLSASYAGKFVLRKKKVKTPLAGLARRSFHSMTRFYFNLYFYALVCKK